jgi:hypothetical protein
VLVAMFCRCYNAPIVWPTGNRLPLASAALAPEKTPRRNSPTFIKKPAMPWLLSSWPNSLKPLGRAARQPSGIPPPRSVFAAPTGKPRHKKLPYASVDRPPQSRRLHPAISRLPRLFSPLLNRACRLNRPLPPLKRLTRRLRTVLLLPSPTRHHAVRAAVAVAVAAIDGKPAPLPKYQPFRRLLPREFRLFRRLLRRSTTLPSLAQPGSLGPLPAFPLNRSRKLRPPGADVTEIPASLRVSPCWRCNSGAC